MIKMNVPKYYPSKYKTKAEAVLDMLKGGETVKQIKNRMAVSDSYIYMIKKHLMEAADEAVETVRQTAAEHTDKVKEMIGDWRAEAEEDWKAEADVDDILDERATTYGSFKDVAGLAQEMKNAIRMCNNSELDDDQIEALDMIATKISRIVNGDPNYVDSWTDIAGYATLVADRLQGKTR